jgi:hypothetical protein
MVYDVTNEVSKANEEGRKEGRKGGVRLLQE